MSNSESWLDKQTNQFINNMVWSQDVYGYTATLIIEHIKKFASFIKKDIDFFQQQLERAKTYTGLESYPCPLCTYENGKFIKFCALHQRINELESKIEIILKDGWRENEDNQSIKS